MARCPVCNFTEYDSATTCRCGYDFEKKEIIDRQKIRAYISRFAKSNPRQWVQEVRLKREINQIQLEKYPNPTWNSRYGWSGKKTAELLGEGNNVTSPDIRLAEALDKHPELKHCKNKRQANTCFKEINEGGSSFKKFESEKRLQEYLEANWEKTPFGSEWDLRECQYNTGKAGVIDLIARHREKARWLIIELKKGKTSDSTVGQIKRYMGWFIENHADKNEKVEGLIISGFPQDEWIRFALKDETNIKQKMYYLSENDEPKFVNPDDPLADCARRPEHYEKLFKKYEGRLKTSDDA